MDHSEENVRNIWSTFATGQMTLFSPIQQYQSTEEKVEISSYYIHGGVVAQR